MGSEIAGVILVAVLLLVVAIGLSAFLPAGVLAVLAIVGIGFLVLAAISILR